ncbi:MAG: mechanosensitive ion channel [Deltaproteobacteria bacterium]|nr:mechanosensitive ion channel [Deltaproteobacteria bacterium]
MAVAMPLAAQAPSASASGVHPADSLPAASSEPTPARTTAAQPTVLPSASADSTAKTRTSTIPVLNAWLGAAPDNVRRETPRETLSGFIDAAREQDFARAAHYLNLSRLQPGEQRKLGPQLAHQLFEVLENQVWFDLDAVNDDPNGGLDKAAAVRELQVAAVPIKGGTQGIRLTRVADATGRQVWVFSVSTVDAIRDLHKRYGPPEFLESVPSWMKERPVVGLDPWQWFGLGLLLGACWAIGLIVQKLAGGMVRALIKRRGAGPDPKLTRALESPTGWLTGLVLLLATLPGVRLQAPAEQLLTRLIYIAIIFSVMRAAVRLINHGAALFEKHAIASIDEDLKRRAIATQVTMLRRIGVVLVVIVGVAVALMQFPVVRTVGWSLLGSAGIVGAIIGFAAQKTFANLFAGIVISITQPIRIGDTVVVEKEWGQIEEIGTTHVVVKLWDLRRLVLPIVFFLDQPFQNWTRTDAEVVGIVQLHVDYRVDVELVRQELDKILKDEPLWNGKTGALIVEELHTETVGLRISLSAADAGKLWDLRCKVREKMLAFLQQGSHRLPVRRVESLTVDGTRKVDGPQ